MPPKIFADSDFLVGLADPQDNRGEASGKIFENLVRRRVIGGLDGFVVSDYCLTEVFQGVQKNLGLEAAIEFFDKVKRQAHIVQTTEAMIRSAVESKLAPLSHKHAPPKAGGRRIGLVDAVTLVIMDRQKLPWLLSYDRGFDEIPLIAPRRIYDLQTCKERARGPQD